MQTIIYFKKESEKSNILEFGTIIEECRRRKLFLVINRKLSNKDKSFGKRRSKKIELIKKEKKKTFKKRKIGGERENVIEREKEKQLG
jgi:hypothetical protein